MSLRTRLALSFAVVALVTAAVVALATPWIVGRGFARMQADGTGAPGQGQGPGAGMGMGPGQGSGQGLGIHAQQVQQETIVTLIAVALAAAGAASVTGFFIASRVARPLEGLAGAAAAVAHGDLSRRSGIADRTDELGDLGRSFDEMAAELEGAEADRRRFFQDVVHELKTPLAVIDATTSAILDGVYQHDDRHLETIRDQSRLLARIVDDLRTIGLAESGRLPLVATEVPVGPLLTAVAVAFEARSREREVRVVAGGVAGLAVRADADRLRQIVGALVDNAIRHAPPGSAVTLAARPEPPEGDRGPRVRISVTDLGSGVDPADAARVFDRFYQADPSRDRSTKTSGLGLAIVRALTVAQGGEVGLDPVEPHGAHFWVDLPAVEPAPAGA